MRSVKRLWLLSIVLPLLAGCEDRDLLSKGPNTAFRVTDTNERTAVHERYFALICNVAAVTKSGCPDEGSNDWKIVAYAALNDIDDRCEIYISSLRQAYRDGRADGGSFLSEGSHIARATNIVLGKTLDNKTGAKAIAVVGAAFGLSLKTAETYYSRLLLSVPPHNVQQLILKRQTSFRKALEGYDIAKKDKAGKPLKDANGNISVDHWRRVVRSKSEAYHVIQSYLRICQPDTIEASVFEGVEDFIDFTSMERVPPSTAGLAVLDAVRAAN